MDNILPLHHESSISGEDSDRLLFDCRWSFSHWVLLCVKWLETQWEYSVMCVRCSTRAVLQCWRHGVERADWRGNWLAWRAARDGGAATHSPLGGPTVNTELLWPSDRRSRRHLPFSFYRAAPAHVRPSLLYSGVWIEPRLVKLKWLFW